MAQSYGTSASYTVDMEGPFSGFGGGTAAKITQITIPAANWKGAESPYSQVVEVDGITTSSMVNLQPSVEQLQIFHDKDLAFVTENEDGVVTIYAVGEKPEEDYTMQAMILEVTA